MYVFTLLCAYTHIQIKNYEMYIQDIYSICIERKNCREGVPRNDTLVCNN